MFVRPSAPKALFVVTGMAAVLLACGDLSERRVIADDVRKARDAVTSIRRCTPSESAAARPIASVSPFADEVGIFSGPLELGAACTLMWCGEGACCNSCGTLASLHAGEDREGPVLRWKENESPLAFGITDCSIEPVAEELKRVEVVVRGRLEVLEYATSLHVDDVCRVE